MAKYCVNGAQYETSLSGLVIKWDTNQENVLFLEPIDGEWEKYFEADPNWCSSGKNKAIILYTLEDNLRAVDRLVYIAWESADDPNNAEMEIALNPEERAYLSGLLHQWFKSI